MINGPARTRLDVNCTAGCFGPGWRANATIGRALRLVIRNVCRAIPNFLDRASYSTPARYSFCFGEDEEGSPWVPLSVERGVPAGTSAVTVHSVMTMSSALDLTSRTPEGVLDSVAAHIRTRGVATDEWLGIDNTVMLVMGPEHRRFLVDEGWSKDDARAYLFPRLKAGERPVRIGRPDGILIVAAGGPGMSETWVLFPHLAWAITSRSSPNLPRPSLRSPGRPTGSVDMSIVGLDPTSGPLPEPEQRAAPRPASLDGAVVGIVSNGLGESDHVLHAVYRELAAISGARDLVFVRKPSVSVPPDPMDWEKLISQITRGGGRVRRLRLVQCAQFARLRGTGMGRHPERGHRARIDGGQRAGHGPRLRHGRLRVPDRALPTHPVGGVVRRRDRGGGADPRAATPRPAHGEVT